MSVQLADDQRRVFMDAPSATKRTYVLYRAHPDGPLFEPLSSWSEGYELACDRAAQLVVKYALRPPIWAADVPIDDGGFLDARNDSDALLRALNCTPSERLRDAVRERPEVLVGQGWQWVAFTELDQPGPEFVYLVGPAIRTKQVYGPPVL